MTDWQREITSVSIGAPLFKTEGLIFTKASSYSYREQTKRAPGNCGLLSLYDIYPQTG